MNRALAASHRRGASGYAAPVDRPRHRRASEDATSRAVARGILHGVEVRDAGGTGGDLTFRGYASVTENAYDMWDAFGPYTETIARGAFADTLATNADVAFLLNHGGMTLARTSSGTLRLGEDDTGLLVEADLDPANSVVRDMASGLRRGDLSELSFAFRIVRGTWDPSFTAYRIEQVDMQRGDVSVVNYGANPATGDHPVTLTSALDVDALEEEEARALADRLAVRLAPPAGAVRRGTVTLPPAELAGLRAIGAPHPLTGRAH